MEAAAPGDDVKERTAPQPEAGSATWAPVRRRMPAGRSHREERRDRGPRPESRLRLWVGALSWRLRDWIPPKGGLTSFLPVSCLQGALRTVAFECFYFRCTFHICLNIYAETGVSPNSIYFDFNFFFNI